MKWGFVVLSSSCAFSTLACGGGVDAAGNDVADAAAFEGIYQLSAASENTAGCDSPGASKLAELHDQFFVVTASDVFGQKFVVLNSCSGVADCQAKRAAQLAKQGYRIEYTFAFSGSSNAATLNGFAAGTGTGEGTQCVDRTYADHVLTLAADHSVHLESRTKKLADQAQNDGFCEVEPAKAKQEAASAPCSSLEVIDGRFLQAK